MYSIRDWFKGLRENGFVQDWDYNCFSQGLKYELNLRISNTMVLEVIY
jgi:hypothetical protein